MALPTYTPHASYTNVDYTSSFVAATATERCSVFFPTGFTPGTSDAMPCLLFFDNAGFNSGSIPASIASSTGGPTDILYEALSRGIPVVFATTTQTENVADGGPAGAGTFKPPIVAPTEWNDLTLSSFAKSAIHVVQWIKENAAALSIDPDQIYTGGRSGGAAPALWVALGTDWTDASITTAGQFRAGISSRVAGCLVFMFHSWWRAHDQQTVPAPYAPDISSPTDTVAEFHEDAATAIQIRASPMHYGFIESVYSGIQTTNSTARVFLYSPGPIYAGLAEPGESVFGLDVNGLPTLYDTITDLHDGWHVVMLWRRLYGLNPAHFKKTGRCVFKAESVTTNFGHTHTVTNDADAYRMMALWILASAGLQPPVPLSEQILQEFETRIEEITAGDEYYHTPASVSRGIQPLFGGPYPAINITTANEDYLPVGEETVQSLTSRMRVVVTFLHDSVEFGERWTHETKDDIKYAILRDQQLSGLVIDTQLQSIDYFKAEDPSSGLAGAEMEFEVYYRTPSTDYTYPR